MHSHLPPPHARSRRSPRVLAAALLAVLAASCGDETRFGDEGYGAPVSTEASRDWDSGESRVVKTLEIPETVDEWPTSPGHSRIIEPRRAASGTRAIELEGSARRRLSIPLPDDIGEFNQIVFETFSPVHSFVLLELLANGERVYSLPGATVIGRPFSQELVIDMPSTRTLDERPDELSLTFTGGEERTVAWNFALRFRPWESWAAKYEDEESRPVLDEVSRPGTAIATDNPRSTTFDAPPGGRLLFFGGIDPELTAPGSDLGLHVRLSSADASQEHRFDLSNEGTWTRCAIPLAELAGREVAIEFRLESDHPGTDYAFLSSSTVYAPIEEPRTVLFVTSDTHRADHVEAITGSTDVATPALDALGERGIVFDDCYSSTNVTVPSHVSLLTATPPRDTMVLDNMSGVAVEALTLAEAFHEAGFATYAAVSGSQLQHSWSGLGQGFDAMACPSKLTWRGSETLDRLEHLVADAEHRDVFVWLHLFDAHRPYDSKSSFIGDYWKGERDPFDSSLPDPEFPKDHLKGDLSGVRDKDYVDALYKAEVTYVDHVLSKLLSQDRFRDGWIAVTADHGECLGEYDIWWDHAGMYPENLHVPLILAGPDVPQGRHVTGPVEHLDIGRTLLDLAGLENHEFPGSSMLRHLERNPEPDTPRFGLSAQAKTVSLELNGWFCALHLGSWRRPGRTEQIREHSVELYNLRPGGDPLRNVAYEEVERSSRMRALMLDWLADQRPTGWVEQDKANDAERIGQVQALGYTAEATDGSAIWIDPECACEPCTTFARR